MKKEYAMRLVDYDEQHHAVCCGECHAMMGAEDILIPTDKGTWACLNCVDREHARGVPMLAMTILGAVEQ